MTSLFSKHAGELYALTLRLDDPVTERVHDRAGGCLVAAGLSGAAAERLAQHQLRHEPAHNRRVWLRGLSRRRTHSRVAQRLTVQLTGS